MRLLLVLVVAAALAGVGCAGPFARGLVRNGGYTTLDYVVVGRRLLAAEVGGPHVVEVGSGCKQLVLIGTVHQAPPSHPQFAAISRHFARLRPQVALVEGGVPPTRHYPSFADASRMDGESGALKYLADEAGIPIENGDLRPADEFTLALREHPADELFVYLVMERIAIPYRYGAFPHEAFDAVYAREVESYLVGNGFPVPSTAKDLEGFAALYRRFTGADFDPEHFDLEAFDYVNPDCRFCELGRAAKMRRDRHLLSRIEAAFARHDRVIVTFGMGHALAIEPALGQVLARHHGSR